MRLYHLFEIFNMTFYEASSMVCWFAILLGLPITIQTSCDSNPCLHGGECLPNQQNQTQFTCQCKGQWTGELCNDKDGDKGPCDSNPCLHGGECPGRVSPKSAEPNTVYLPV
ncbi:uncharacterized protein [Amphiura filiformis]|uniref:uncharacterized protein n=1 Tax=Amphiura filiformis TaxID=82378 RepID=UPI003B21433A